VGEAGAVAGFTTSGAAAATVSACVTTLGCTGTCLAGLRVVVTFGTLALYQVIDNRCVKSTYGPGQGFVETPGVVHIARNEGASGDVTAVATFLGIAPGTTAYKTLVPAPAACPGIK